MKKTFENELLKVLEQKTQKVMLRILYLVSRTFTQCIFELARIACSANERE